MICRIGNGDREAKKREEMQKISRRKWKDGCAGDALAKQKKVECR